jgi:hypothetical protein
MTTYQVVGGHLDGKEYAALGGLGLMVPIWDEAGRLWIGRYEYVIGSDVALFASLDLDQS